MQVQDMKFRYPLGWPFWKYVAQAGVPLSVRIDVHLDDETNTYWADSPNIDGLIVSGATLDELKSEVLSAASLLLEESASEPKRRIEANLNLHAALA